MPDRRRHRGPHPQDRELFGPAAQPALARAAADLAWLLDRGYVVPSALKLVGDRHGLRERQRTAVLRLTCTTAQRRRRRAHEVPVGRLRGRALAVDGLNLLITVEAALAGGVLLRGRDGTLRDLASLHGSFRAVEETPPAIGLVGRALAAWGVARARWLLDRPVSNSGRLAARLRAAADAAGWAWTVEVVPDPDAELARAGDVVASADGAVLDRAAAWANVASRVVARFVPGARILDPWRRGGAS